jgi:hypothetical protein
MAINRVQVARDFAALITKTVRKLESGEQNGVLASAIGSELQRLGELDTLSQLGHRKLTDFIKEQCPNLTIEHLPHGKGVLICPRRLQGPQTSTDNVAQFNPESPGAGSNGEPPTVGAEGSREPRVAANWSPRLTEWLEARYSNDDGVTTADAKPDIGQIIEQIEARKYASIVSELKPLISLILADSKSGGVTPSDSAMIAACCRADAELAAASGSWELAADLLLAALETARDDLPMVVPAFLYAQVVATS